MANDGNAGETIQPKVSNFKAAMRQRRASGQAAPPPAPTPAPSAAPEAVPQGIPEGSPAPGAPAPAAPQATPRTVVTAGGVEVDAVTGKPVGDPAAQQPQQPPEAAPEGEPAPPEGGEGDEPQDLYGMPVSDVMQALRDGILPAELLEHLSIVGTYDGDDELITLADARDGRLRELDYSRKTQEVAEQRREAEQLANHALETFQTWKDQERPVGERAELFEALIGEDQALEMAAYFLERWQVEQGLEEPARRHVQKTRRDALAMKYDPERMQEQLKQGAQGPGKADDHTQANRNVMKKHYGPTLKALGMPNSREVQDIFRANLPAFWDQEGPLTAKAIRSAAIATKQRLQELGHKFTSPKPQGNGQPARPQAPTAPGALPVRADSTGAASTDGPGNVAPTLANFKKRNEERRRARLRR